MSSKKVDDRICFTSCLERSSCRRTGAAKQRTRAGRQEMEQLKQEYEQQRLAYEQRLGKLEEQLKRMETSSPAPAAVSVATVSAPKPSPEPVTQARSEFRRSTIVSPRRAGRPESESVRSKRLTPFNWLLPSRKTTASASGRNVFCANTSISRDTSEQATDVMMRVALKSAFRHQEPWRKDAWATRLKTMENSSSARISIFREHFH